MFLKNKKVKVDNVSTDEKIGLKIIGEDTPFNFLDEKTNQISKKKYMRISRRDNHGDLYWESVKPYEIIDGNLCVRSKSDIPTMTGWIVLSKTEIEDILHKM